MPALSRSLMLAVLLAALAVTLTLAFAEEPLHFRDPYTGEVSDDEINSIHFDLSYSLGLAAGFTISDSMQIQLWNQLVDSEQLGPGDAADYSNCGGGFYPAPDPHQICSSSVDTSQVAWPLWDQMKDPATCVTSRFGPYSPFFHFPHNTPAELGALHDWGWGENEQLVGYQAYAWGAATVLEAPCVYTSTVPISTTIAAGSLEAFATYLHSLGDYYSHRDCLEALEAIDAPWGTHTNPLGNDIYACNYIPANPNNLDAHGREYGSAYAADSGRVIQGILAMYAELERRSLRYEGGYFPLALGAPLAGLSGASTLREAIEHFIYTWPFDNPANPGGPAAERRAYAEEIANAVLAQRQAITRLYLPNILR